MDVFECGICNKKFETEESLEQHNKAKHFSIEKKPRSWKKYFLLSLFIITLIIFGITVYSQVKKPGLYENFTKCLTDKAIIYGNDFCSYTNQQMNMFGKAKKYLSYVKCIDNEELCNSKGVKITPTWEINGKTYQGVQSFETLARLTECEI